MAGNEKQNAGSKVKKVPLTGLLDRNIQALIDARKASESERGLHERLVSRIVTMISSMGFLYMHAFVLCCWAVLQFGLFGIPPVHIISFTRLSELASMEAIFLSVLVLINQRSIGELVETREDFDLQMSLITEHEITRILNVVDLIAREMKINTAKVADIEEAKKDISPEMVLERIEDLKDKNKGYGGSPPK